MGLLERKLSETCSKLGVPESRYVERCSAVLSQNIEFPSFLKIFVQYPQKPYYHVFTRLGAWDVRKRSSITVMYRQQGTCSGSSGSSLEISLTPCRANATPFVPYLQASMFWNLYRRGIVTNLDLWYLYGRLCHVLNTTDSASPSSVVTLQPCSAARVPSNFRRC